MLPDKKCKKSLNNLNLKQCCFKTIVCFSFAQEDEGFGEKPLFACFSVFSAKQIVASFDIFLKVLEKNLTQFEKHNHLFSSQEM